MGEKRLEAPGHKGKQPRAGARPSLGTRGGEEEQEMHWWLSRRTLREFLGTLILFSFINGQDGFSVNGNDREREVQKGWGAALVTQW